MDIIGKRRWFQAFSALAFNAYLPNWIKGEIYQGSIKGICVPVLNCYSCPSAVVACPIGAMQNLFASARFKISISQFQLGFYVIGVLGAIGSLVGRLPCGWLCPFGLVQELLYKIKSPKISIPPPLSYLKYIVLGVLVIGLPLLIMDEYGMGQIWFCKWICPAGTLEAGIPLASLNESIRHQIGFLFSWKVGVLLLFLVLMVMSKRPFCRTVCPLGAIFGIFNNISLFRMIIDEEKCAKCDQCFKECPVEITIMDGPNSPECIRCLKCKSACEFGAIDYEFIKKKPSPAELHNL